ncbi:3-carboxy-cis,cis-mucoante lactonizing enzyme [Serendipita vermifera]|nr:3-carboxy-cis,cis-mucoante lactonizing enzyme [Serendipita vermifera]
MASTFLILVGSFSTYISSLKFVTSPPSLTLVTQTPSGSAPSWILQSPFNKSIIYATDEIPDGHLNSLVLNHKYKNLTHIDSISTQGTYPTHIGAVLDGNTLGVANYYGSSAFIVPLGKDHLTFSSSPQVVSFNGSGPQPQQLSAHPHQILKYGQNILVTDLGSDKVWQLGLNKTNAWTTRASISETPGNGPRHSVIVGRSFYTLCELSNNITQFMLSVTGLKNAAFVKTQSIRPPDTDVSAPLAAAELLYAESPTPLLYASNRNDPHLEGDAITVLEISPKLKPVAYVRTGLNYIRGMEFVGPKKEYVIAAGMNGGGIKIFKRVSAKSGYLSEVAHLPNGTIAQPSSFVWTNW